MARPRTRSHHTDRLISLLRAGMHDGRALALQLGLRPRSLTRLLTDLRDEGHRIVAVRDRSSWSYRIEQATPHRQNGGAP